jgi:hypothetical protein
MAANGAHRAVFVGPSRLLDRLRAQGTVSGMWAARHAIRKTMRPGETIDLDGRAICLLDDTGSLASRDVLLAVTDEHLIWAALKLPKPEEMRIRHDDVVRASFDGERLRLTRRASDPPEETEVWFSFPYGDRGVSVLKALEARIGKLGPPRRKKHPRPGP